MNLLEEHLLNRLTSNFVKKLKSMEDNEQKIKMLISFISELSPTQSKFINETINNYTNGEKIELIKDIEEYGTFILFENEVTEDIIIKISRKYGLQIMVGDVVKILNYDNGIAKRAVVHDVSYRNGTTIYKLIIDDIWDEREWLDDQIEMIYHIPIKKYSVRIKNN